MKILNTAAFKRIGFVLLTVVAMGACSKHEFVIDEFIPDRMFMPGGVIRFQSGETDVRLVWDKPVNTEGEPSYTIELAKDSLFDNGPLHSFTSDTTGIALTDQQIEVRERYFARVKTNATQNVPESKWLYSNGFMIRGKQLFTPIDQQIDLQDTWVMLRWRPDETARTIVILEGDENPQAVQEIILTAADIENGYKLVEGLNPVTFYRAWMLDGDRATGVQIGLISFITKEPSNFTIEVDPTDDLETILSNAENGDVIGLLPGTHDITSNVITILQRHIVIGAVSGNPVETILNLRGFDLRGDGAGVHLEDLTVDMLDRDGGYLFDLKGETSDGGAANFSSIEVKGCIVQHIGRAFVRGSRAGNRVHNIDYIRVENSILRDNDVDYALFELQKLGMNRFEIINTTINGVSNNILRYDTNIGAPGVEIVLDHVTINAFGNANRRALMDVNTPATIAINNSVIANAVWASRRYSNPTVAADLFRAGNGATATVSNTNLYNLMNTATPPAALSIPNTAVLTNVTTHNLPWTYTSDSFELPSGSPLWTQSNTNGPIGDPRWTR